MLESPELLANLHLMKQTKTSPRPRPRPRPRPAPTHEGLMQTKEKVLETRHSDTLKLGCRETERPILQVSPQSSNSKVGMRERKEKTVKN